MFAYLKGEITFRTPAYLTLEVGGVGYHLNISLGTYTALEGGARATLFRAETGAAAGSGGGAWPPPWGSRLAEIRFGVLPQILPVMLGQVLYYFESLTMRDIGIVLGICEGRVSQIHALLLERLRARMVREQEGERK